MREQGTRQLRVCEILRKHVAVMLQSECRDPRVGRVTVTDVTISKDLKAATVYLDITDKAQATQTLEILNKAAGFFRAGIAEKAALRNTPKLVFKQDKNVDRVARLEALLQPKQEDDQQDGIGSE